MFIKKSLQVLKEKFYPLFLIDLVFLFATFFFLVFAKNKLATYMLQLQAFSAQAAAFQQGTDQTQLALFLDKFQSLTSTAIFFAYVIIPVAIIGVWIITQTGFWYVLKQQHIKHKKAFIAKAVLGHIISFAIGYASIFFIPMEFSIFDVVDTSILKAIIGAILLFILMTFLSVLENQSFWKTVQFTGQKLKKGHKLVLPFLFFLVVFMTMIYLLLTLFTTYMEGVVILVSMIPLTLYLLIVMLLSIWLKIIFLVTVQRED